jgi:ABC-type transporter Mla subunit MlaD
LPVQNTTTPVGLDLLNNIMRLPQQQKFQLIINGLGAGLAGNGEQLNAALKRADPALQQTDRVIAVLASQNQLLARLTDESAHVLAPLAAQRAGLAGFFEHAGRVAVASAQEGQAIEQNWKDLPPFLRQFTPAVERFGNLASQMTPAIQELHAQAPAINATAAGLGPLAKTSIPAFKTLGTLAQKGEAVFPKIKPVATQLLSLSKPLLPLATDIAAIAQSFDNAGGIENVMRFIYYYTGTVNGENALGHYIRSQVVVTQNTRTSQLAPSASAQFSCTNVTPNCGRKVPVGQASAAQDASTSSALLHYLLGP